MHVSACMDFRLLVLRGTKYNLTGRFWSNFYHPVHQMVNYSLLWSSIGILETMYVQVGKIVFDLELNFQL